MCSKSAPRPESSSAELLDDALDDLGASQIILRLVEVPGVAAAAPTAPPAPLAPAGSSPVFCGVVSVLVGTALPLGPFARFNVINVTGMTVVRCWVCLCGG